MRFKRAAASAVAMSMASVGLVVGLPSSATAVTGVTINSVTVSPSTPVLRPGKPTSVTVKVKFNATLDQAVDPALSWIVFQRGDEVYEMEEFEKRDAYDAVSETWSTTFDLTSPHVGQTYVGVSWLWDEQSCYIDDILGETCELVDSGFETQDNVKSFAIKAQSKASVKAPAKVTKGKNFRVKGTVSQASYPGWTVRSGQTVQIWFDPKVGGGPRRVATTRTNSYGLYSKKFEARKSGAWFVKVPGSTQLLPFTSAKDIVKVV